jgi:WD40 repeat protein
LSVVAAVTIIGAVLALAFGFRETESGTPPCAVIRRNAHEFWRADFSPDGQRILTVSEDRTANLWDLEGNELAAFEGHDGPIKFATFSPSGDRVLTTSDDKTARLWDLAGNQIRILTGHSASVWHAAFSPSGDRIATASADKTARIWDLDGNELTPLEGHDAAVSSVRFAPAGDRIVTASYDLTARVWDTAGKETRKLQGHEWDCPGSFTKHYASASFSPSGDLVLTVAYDKTALVWDLHGNRLAALDGHREVVVSAVFSVSGDFILTCPRRYVLGSRLHGSKLPGKGARVWNREGRLIALLEGEDLASFSPCGTRIVTARDTRVSLRSLDGTLHAELPGNTAEVWHVAFSPHGTHVLTISADQTIRLWDVEVD